MSMANSAAVFPARSAARSIALALCVGVVAWPPLAAAREPPAPGCVDLYALTGGWRTGEHEILLRARADDGVRLELDPGCPAFGQGVDLVASAPGGWACPGQSATVRGGGTRCPVVRVVAMTPARVAEALRVREENLATTLTLKGVEVRGRHWRDIRGTTDHCVDARFLRGWRGDDEGLVVEVAPRRHAGHRYYRVHTVGRCPDLASAHSVRLVARSGGAAVCGYPGDKVALKDYPSAGFEPMGVPANPMFERGCEISRVVPMARD